MLKPVVSLGTANDALECSQIERQCFSSFLSHSALERDIVENPRSMYLIARIDGQIAGYMSTWRILDESHIINVAVLPGFRRMGIATMLIREAFKRGRNAGIAGYTLEVRAGNVGAINLYEGLGFKVEGRRPNYYENNGEDGLIMWRTDNDL